MSTSIEREIQTLLKNVGDPSLVADEMLKKWHRDELGEEDLERISHFLITFGFHTSLAENLALKIKENFKVPWSAVARLIACARTAPDKEIVDQVLIGATEQKSLDQLARFPNLENVDTRFKKIRDQFLKERHEVISNLKRNLLTQADIAKNDRMFDREKEILKKLLFMYPDDEALRERFAEFSSRLAKEKLARPQSRLDQEELYRRELNLTPEQKKLTDEIAKKLQKKIKKNSSLGYDVAISLYQLGDFESALNILKSVKPTTASEWLEVELLLETRRFVDTLTKLDEMEKKYATDPESTPAIVYARAKALWGLHQPESAIDLLEHLVKVRPDYRSASSLLQQWKVDLG